MRQAVKCRPLSLSLRDRAMAAGLVLALGFALAPPARGQLLGGGFGPKEPRPPPPLDASIPTGAEVRTPPRPPTAPEPPTCSLRYAACVHRAPGIAPPVALAWLDAVDGAFGRLMDGLGLPPPLPDGDRGGNGSLDVYLVPNGPSDVDVAIDRLDVGVGTDSASAFCVAGGTAASAERRATLCVAEAVLLRLDAAETPFSRRALATSLWLATGTPESDDYRAFDDAQAHPERGVLARERSDVSEGSALLYEYLDATRGRGGPGAAALATYALAAQHGRSPAGPRLVNEPDAADVLRATFGPTPTDVARFFSDFAVSRAFIGSRDAEGTTPSLDFLGDFGRVRFEWSVPAKSLPRQLAPLHPIEPLGSTYLWVSLDGSLGEKNLVFQADWEQPVAFRWALVLVGERGSVVRRFDVPFLERGTHVERVVTDLSGGIGLLVVGTNLGGLGPSYPFDPDFEPFEPHGYSVTLSLL